MSGPALRAHRRRRRRQVRHAAVASASSAPSSKEQAQAATASAVRPTSLRTSRILCLSATPAPARWNLQRRWQSAFGYVAAWEGAAAGAGGTQGVSDRGGGIHRIISAIYSSSFLRQGVSFCPHTPPAPRTTRAPYRASASALMGKSAWPALRQRLAAIRTRSHPRARPARARGRRPPAIVSRVQYSAVVFLP